MNQTSSPACRAWRPGDRLLLDEHHTVAVVEDLGAGAVCCGWMQDGIHRRSWIPAERLRCARALSRVPVSPAHH